MSPRSIERPFLIPGRWAAASQNHRAGAHLAFLLIFEPPPPTSSQRRCAPPPPRFSLLAPESLGVSSSACFEAAQSARSRPQRATGEQLFVIHIPAGETAHAEHPARRPEKTTKSEHDHRMVVWIVCFFDPALHNGGNLDSFSPSTGLGSPPSPLKRRRRSDFCLPPRALINNDCLQRALQSSRACKHSQTLCVVCFEASLYCFPSDELQRLLRRRTVMTTFYFIVILPDNFTYLQNQLPSC